VAHPAPAKAISPQLLMWRRFDARTALLIVDQSDIR
jgi:hypothetical protein